MCITSVMQNNLFNQRRDYESYLIKRWESNESNKYRYESVL